MEQFAFQKPPKNKQLPIHEQHC